MWLDNSNNNYYYNNYTKFIKRHDPVAWLQRRIVVIAQNSPSTGRGFQSHQLRCNYGPLQDAYACF